jgi:hypothetical protein
MDVNIAFTSTGYGPLWAPAVSSWLRTIAYTARQFSIESIGKVGGAGVTDRTYTHQAQNMLIAQMLAHEPKFTHIFMTEADMILPHDAIIKLLALDKDMASGVYFLRSDRPEYLGQPCLFKRSMLTPEERKDKPDAEYLVSQVHIFPTDAPFRVDCAGLGCILIKRNVFETMKEPWFDVKANSYGSDIYFTKHSKDAGFDIWVDPTVLCGQIDYYETTIDEYKWQLDHDPTFALRGFIIGYGEQTPS